MPIGSRSRAGSEVAVIGMAVRAPGARNSVEFWENLRDGVESVKFFTADELLAAGESPELIQDPCYVKAQPVLSDIDLFDAGFFGLSPQDAAIMDPQHRIMLEVAWEALENAGHAPESVQGAVGVFATCGINAYMMYNLLGNRHLMETVGDWLVRYTGNDMNLLATRISYAMNLKGPSMNVQTSCSSALVAVHLARQSLLNGECDMALAGGCTVNFPHDRGYLYRPGEILSPDGHCRPFDARGAGTIFGSGAGVVVLRRLSDALADGDRIGAVILGSAVNNDGSKKASYLAPSVEGQSRAIAQALEVSGVDPETISLVEAHGTSTRVGDPIELAGLTEAYRRYTQKTGFCAIGSLKSNIGHLNEAAGIVSFIKTVLALQHRQIPPSLHFENPNPQFDFASSPFFVNAELRDWQADGAPRRAGVTALGVGGTNCHVIVEEASDAAPSGTSRPSQLLMLSAATPAALDAAVSQLAAHLEEHPNLNLADVAFTLSTGRKALAFRRTVICTDRGEVIAALSGANRSVTSKCEDGEPSVTFLFPGQGSQYPYMGYDLYRHERVFREIVDECTVILKPELGVDLREALYGEQDLESMREALNQTALTQPALFAVEYALAKLWMSWGVRPQAMIGHSVGEFVAACLAGVFSLSEALALVAVRGRLMQAMPAGAMLSVLLPPAQTEVLINGHALSVAAVNAPALSVVSGPFDAIATFETELASRGVQSQRLHTSHAFHSSMMDPILEPFHEQVRRTPLQAPGIPYVSNVTGTWIGEDEARTPSYWVEHLRGPVRFADGVSTLLKKPNQLILEVGPGNTLSTLVRQQPAKPLAVFSSLPRPNEEISDEAFLLDACGRLWSVGVPLDWRGFWAGEQRRRVALPTYPFQRRSYWITPDKVTAGAPRSDSQEQAETSSQAVAQPSTAALAATEHDPLERRLAEILTEILGVESAGLQDDFFDLGGNSLLLARFAARIEKDFKKLIPLPLLFKSATIEEIAGLLRETSPKQSSFLIPLNEPSSGPTFYCVHAVGGDAMGFRHLAKSLSQVVKFYGVQVPGENRTPAFASSIEAMARRYVDEVVAFQRQGPYLLGGWSAGVPLSLEMAQQLQRLGHTVSLLVALDCAPYNTGGESSRWDPLYHWKLLRNIPQWLADNLGTNSARKTALPSLSNKLKAVAKKMLAGLRGEKELAGYEVEGWIRGSDYSERQLEFSRALYSAVRRYNPQPYNGRVVLYQSKTQPLYHLFEFDRCWRKLAAQVEIVAVNGTHSSLLDQFHVDKIAQDLAQRLPPAQILRSAPVGQTARIRFLRSRVKEDEARYHLLCVAAHELSQWIAQGPRPEESQSAVCLWQAAVESVLHPPKEMDGPILENREGAVFEALAKLRADWPDLRTGKLRGESAYASSQALWERLMCEWPLGSYPAMAAEFVNSYAKEWRSVVELGAGVGSASRLIALPSDVDYLRTDRNPFLLRGDLPGRVECYDFDNPSTLRNVDLVFAVNALHCASNYRVSLSYVYEMLRPGGTFLLGEGCPRTNRRAQPWALNVFYCQFEGWWNRGGFRLRDEWISDLKAIGFRSIEWRCLQAGEHDLGGLIWSRK